MAERMTAQQVAERWAVSEGHVRKLARTGRLSGLHTGSAWRFSLAAVEAYEAAHTTSAETVQQTSASQPTSPGLRALRPAVDLGGEYAPVFTGPVPWRSTVIEAASPAARRGGSATKKKAGSQR